MASRPLYSVCQCWRNCCLPSKCYIYYHFSVIYLCYHFRLVISGIEASVLCVSVLEELLSALQMLYVIISQSVTYVTILDWWSVASRPLYSVCRCWRNCCLPFKCYICYHFSVSYLCYHFWLVVSGIEAPVLCVSVLEELLSVLQKLYLLSFLSQLLMLPF